MSGFTEEQITKLDEKLDPKNIKIRKDGGFPYVEGFHVIGEANRIFGYDGWSYEITRLEEISQHTNNKGTMIVGYICRTKVSAGGISREDTGYGTGMSKTDVSRCHELASKEAVTDALKRTLRTFGNQFGLPLYDKDKSENIGEDKPPPENFEKTYQKLLDAVGKLDDIDKVNRWESLDSVKNARDRLPDELAQNLETAILAIKKTFEEE